MSATEPKDNKVAPKELPKIPVHQLNPSYTVRVICCVFFIFITEIFLAHYVYRLIVSEIRDNYLSKNSFRQNFQNEIRTEAFREEVLRIHAYIDLHKEQKTIKTEPIITKRERRSLRGSKDFNLLADANVEEPHVEFFNPNMRLIVSEIRDNYLSKNSFRQNFQNEIRTEAFREEVLRIHAYIDLHKEQKTIKTEPIITKRERRSLRGSKDFNLLADANVEEPHVEFLSLLLLIISEIRDNYLSKNSFRQNFQNEIRTEAFREEVLRIHAYIDLHKEQKTIKTEPIITKRERRSLRGSKDFNLLADANVEEPHVEFFNPNMRSLLEEKDEEIRRRTGKGAAPGDDQWIWVTSSSRIPACFLDTSNK